MQKSVAKYFPAVHNAQENSENLFSRKRILSFLISLFQLFCILFIVDKLNIESQTGISQIFYFVLISFTITSFVSLRFRPFIFFATTISVAYFAFGLFSGSILILLGLMMIIACHLPIKFFYRILIIGFFFSAMAVFEVGYVYRPRIALVIPFCASMFMFRIILYLYELKHNTTKSTLWQKLSYFFMFPNLCFLFFPIVDYKTYVKTYYSIPDKDLWQKGIRWMLRGIIHYLAYRFVYYYLCVPINEVHNLPQLIQYMSASYALVLRISGLFNFIIGLLCMYGFNLHAPFDNYFLATGFVDLWRRINIYWREFILKIFFYPLVMKLKKTTKYVIPVSTWIMFVITFFLHNYQLFWIRGEFNFKTSDIIFWLTIGSFITADVVIREKDSYKAKKQINKYLSFFYTTLKIVGMFLFMSFMWSFWTSNSISEWTFLMKKATIFSSVQLIKFLLIIICTIAIIFLMHVIVTKRKITYIINILPQNTQFLTIPSIFILFLLFTIDNKKVFPEKIQVYLQALASNSFNENDKQKVDAGYYNQILDGGEEKRSNAWEIPLLHFKKHSNLDDIYIRKYGILSRELKPNAKEKNEAENFVIETNSFGMRDKEYNLKKDSHTYRIAFLGGSYVMGAGVNNENIFENLTEQKLNKKDTNNQIKKYEILNFSMNRYHLMQHVELLNSDRIFKFNPNAVVYFAHSGEASWFLKVFSSLIQNGTDLKYSFVEDIKKQSGVKQSMSDAEIIERLQPYKYTLILWCYLQIEKACNLHKAKPIWVYLPCTNDIVDPQEYFKLQQMAFNLGFITIDLRGVYGNYLLKEIQVSKTNTHPSILGHKLIAQKLYEELLKNKKQIFEIN